jgi:FkbM family methyltransferase
MIKTQNGVFNIDMDDCYIRNHMLSGRVYEHHIINGMLKPHVEKATYIVDCGANIGCHCVSYAGMSPDAFIWAFEPQKKLFDILKTNVSINGYGDRIRLYNKGLGHTEAELELHSMDRVEDKAHMGWNKGGLGIGKGGEKLEIQTLDSMHLPGLDYMKIDVEGAEGLVIQGARETIKKFKPIIVFEHNSVTINPSHVGLEHVPTPFEELVKIGYKKFQYLDWENYIAFAS